MTHRERGGGESGVCRGSNQLKQGIEHDKLQLTLLFVRPVVPLGTAKVSARRQRREKGGGAEFLVVGQMVAAQMLI